MRIGNMATVKIIFMVAVASWLAAVSEAAEWRVDAASSTLAWQATFNGQPVGGTFKEWNADIVFDPANLAQARLKVVVPLTSVDSRDAERDATLKGKDFFDVETHPRAVFESFYVQKDGAGYVADGTLTLAGLKRGASLTFTVDMNGNKALARGTMTLSRKDYGLGKGVWASSTEIGDPVEVTFTVNATKL